MTDTTRVTVGCSARTLRQDHEPHDWQPQPGMDAVHCPGYWIEAPPEPLDAPESDREASTGELAGRSGDSGPQAASSDALRERLVDSLAAYPVACWTPANLADRIMGVVGAELNHWEKAAREQSARAEAAEQRANRLAATLSTALAAMGLHWAHADFHGPQDAYITPEMFKTWRTALEQPQGQRQEALNRVHHLADLTACPEATPDDGPNVKEAAGDDRRWFDAEREGS